MASESWIQCYFIISNQGKNNEAFKFLEDLWESTGEKKKTDDKKIKYMIHLY